MSRLDFPTSDGKMVLPAGLPSNEGSRVMGNIVFVVYVALNVALSGGTHSNPRALPSQVVAVSVEQAGVSRGVEGTPVLFTAVEE